MWYVIGRNNVAWRAVSTVWNTMCDLHQFALWIVSEVWYAVSYVGSVDVE